MEVIINSIMIKKDSLKKIPGSVGVYLFRLKGKILYVGKATNLKARIFSHLEDSKNDRKENLIVSTSDKIEWIETDSEFKALLLESKLIRIHHPIYNVRWRDDKSHLYIKISVKSEYPIIELSRKEDDRDAKYYGPFPSVKSTEDILRAIRRIFPYCAQKRLSKPCFYAKIKLCNPCPSKIERLKDPLLRAKLKKLYRRNIRQIIKVLEGKTDEVLRELRANLSHAKNEQRYEDAISLRDKIYRFERLIFQTTSLRDIFTQYNESAQSTRSLVNLLGIYFADLGALERIECYDISSLAQREATASMVVFTGGIPNKGEYRKFKIKRPNSKSDFEMLDEVVNRRFKNKWIKPHLIVVDGGKPQVRTILRALSMIGRRIRVIGIAKNPDRIIIGRWPLLTIRPSQNNPGFNLVRHIRDESHRFAKKYHLLLRTKRTLL